MVGAIQDYVKATPHEPRLWAELESRVSRIADGLKLDDVADLREIRPVREACL